jgi:hypothetical protein
VLSILKKEQINALLEQKKIESTGDLLENCMRLAEY